MACVENGVYSCGKKVQKACQGEMNEKGNLPPMIAILGYVISAVFCKEYQNRSIDATLRVDVYLYWQHLRLICAPMFGQDLVADP